MAILAVTGVLAWAVLAFGAVYSWAFWPVAAAVVAMAAWRCRRRPRIPRNAVTWTTLLLVAAVVAQLVPLATSVLLSASPAAAAFLTLAMGYIGLPRKLAEFITGLGLAPLWLLFWLMVFYVLLGCFLDGISMVVLTMGVILPTIQKAGIDLVWFGIFIVLVVEMAQITPPVGFNLFVLQGMTKKDIAWIARVSLPLFFLMVAAVATIYFFPGLVTWLPSRM